MVIRAALLVSSGLAVGGSSALGQVVFEGLGDLPGGDFASAAQAVSADGSAVSGFSYCPWPQAFRWTAEAGMVGLGDLPGGADLSNGFAVSADGAVVVGISTSGNGDRAWRWTAQGGMQSLGTLPGGGNRSVANAVSGDGGTVIGESDTGVGNGAFRWTAIGGMEQLETDSDEAAAFGVSTSGKAIVGYESVGINENIAFRWMEQTGVVDLGELPGGKVWSIAFDVSDDGAVVVGESEGPLGLEAFYWTGLAGVVGLGDLPGGDFSSTATAVSADGSVIVGNGQTAAGSEAFLWTEAQGMRRLADVLAEAGAELPGWKIVSATGISADGRVIVGKAINPCGNYEAYIARLNGSPIPCYADCDGNGTLDLFDFLCFVNEFNAGDASADCEPCDQPGVLDLFDFLCFVNKFNAGC
jgi:probable HAF family extracellular repeat protein